jgi:hypothetical protein
MRRFMRVSGLVLFGVFAAAAAARAADNVTLEQALKPRPHQKDVEYDTPSAKEQAQCKLSPLNEGKVTGYIITGPTGQLLRRFLDTNGDDVVDQFSFYKDGVEVYRENDTNGNNKMDQFRWFNFGGTRWGVDSNEDGKIDHWKQISAEEVSRIAVAALVSQDASPLAPLLVTKQDLKDLGIKGALENKLVASVADAAAKLKKAAAGSKVIHPKTTWMRFDAMPPATVPADAIKSGGDVTVYENATALVDYGNATNPGLVHLGELVRIGDVWKLTNLPTPIESPNSVLAPGIIFNEQFLLLGVEGSAPNPSSEKVQKLVEELQKLDSNPPVANASRAMWEKYHKQVEGVLASLIEEVKSEDEKTQLTRRLIDSLSQAVQSGNDPGALKRLKSVEAEIRKSSPKSPLASLAGYRLLFLEYNVAIDEARDKDDEAKQKVHERWLTQLEDFLDEHPKWDDAPDAALQLAIGLEFSGKQEKAEKWYAKTAEDYSDTPAAKRATGCLKRLNLVGKTLALSGASLSGGTVDVKQFRGKIIAVSFWDTNKTNPYLQDLPLLKGLYDEYHSQGFEIIGVNVDPDREAVGPYLKQHGIKWPQIYEPGGQENPLAREFGIIVLPTMFIVDADGKVTHRSATVADLKSLLAEKIAKK